MDLCTRQPVTFFGGIILLPSLLSGCKKLVLDPGSGHGHSRKQKFLMIEAWQQSGLSQKDWCIRESITYHSFHYWYKRYRVAQSIAAGSSTGGIPDKNPGFISLQVQSSFQHQTSAWLELLLTDGRRLLFHSPVSSDYLKVIIS